MCSLKCFQQNLFLYNFLKLQKALDRLKTHNFYNFYQSISVTHVLVIEVMFFATSIFVTSTVVNKKVTPNIGQLLFAETHKNFSQHHIILTFSLVNASDPSITENFQQNWISCKMYRKIQIYSTTKIYGNIYTVSLLPIRKNGFRSS